MLKDLKIIIKHIFSKKALTYRAYGLLWIFGITWAGLKLKSSAISVTLLIVLGKTILYGIIEYFHHRKHPNNKEWSVITYK